MHTKHPQVSLELTCSNRQFPTSTLKRLQLKFRMVLFITNKCFISISLQNNHLYNPSSRKNIQSFTTKINCQSECSNWSKQCKFPVKNCQGNAYAVITPQCIQTVLSWWDTKQKCCLLVKNSKTSHKLANHQFYTITEKGIKSLKWRMEYKG